MAFQNVLNSFLKQSLGLVGGWESRREADMIGLDRKHLDSLFILKVCLDVGINSVLLNLHSSTFQKQVLGGV